MCVRACVGGCVFVRLRVGVVVDYYAEFRLLATLRSRLRQSLLLLLLARSAFWTLLLLLPILLLLLRLLWLLPLLLLSRTQFLKETKKKDSRNKSLAWQRAPERRNARRCC